jgi:soluble lytic murein transglycosylase-like protein
MTAAVITIIIVLALLIWGSLKGEEITMNEADIPAPVKDWRNLARQAANEFGVPLRYVMATIWQESAGDAGAKGSAGERGLMQLKKIAVADAKQRYENKDFSDWQYIPKQNIRAGTAFLKVQKTRTGNWFDALKAYNQGYAGMKDHPDKAQNYAESVTEKAKFF